VACQDHTASEWQGWVGLSVLDTGMWPLAQHSMVRLRAVCVLTQVPSSGALVLLLGKGTMGGQGQDLGDPSVGAVEVGLLSSSQ
jgi:hypothetical protein